MEEDTNKPCENEMCKHTLLNFQRYIQKQNSNKEKLLELEKIEKENERLRYQLNEMQNKVLMYEEHRISIVNRVEIAEAEMHRLAGDVVFYKNKAESLILKAEESDVHLKNANEWREKYDQMGELSEQMEAKLDEVQKKYTDAVHLLDMREKKISKMKTDYDANKRKLEEMKTQKKNLDKYLRNAITLIDALSSDQKSGQQKNYQDLVEVFRRDDVRIFFNSSPFRKSAGKYASLKKAQEDFGLTLSDDDEEDDDEEHAEAVEKLLQNESDEESIDVPLVKKNMEEKIETIKEARSRRTNVDAINIKKWPSGIKKPLPASVRGTPRGSGICDPVVIHAKTIPNMKPSRHNFEAINEAATLRKKALLERTEAPSSSEDTSVREPVASTILGRKGKSVREQQSEMMTGMSVKEKVAMMKAGGGALPNVKPINEKKGNNQEEQVDKRRRETSPLPNPSKVASLGLELSVSPKKRVTRQSFCLSEASELPEDMDHNEISDDPCAEDDNPSTSQTGRRSSRLSSHTKESEKVKIQAVSTRTRSHSIRSPSRSRNVESSKPNCPKKEILSSRSANPPKPRFGLTQNMASSMSPREHRLLSRTTRKSENEFEHSYPIEVDAISSEVGKESIPKTTPSKEQSSRDLSPKLPSRCLIPNIVDHSKDTLDGLPSSDTRITRSAKKSDDVGTSSGKRESGISSTRSPRSRSIARKILPEKVAPETDDVITSSRKRESSMSSTRSTRSKSIARADLPEKVAPETDNVRTSSRKRDPSISSTRSTRSKSIAREDLPIKIAMKSDDVKTSSRKRESSVSSIRSTRSRSIARKDLSKKKLDDPDNEPSLDSEKSQEATSSIKRTSERLSANKQIPAKTPIKRPALVNPSDGPPTRVRKMATMKAPSKRQPRKVDVINVNTETTTTTENVEESVNIEMEDAASSTSEINRKSDDVGEMGNTDAPPIESTTNDQGDKTVDDITDDNEDDLLKIVDENEETKKSLPTISCPTNENPKKGTCDEEQLARTSQSPSIPELPNVEIPPPGRSDDVSSENGDDLGSLKIADEFEEVQKSCSKGDETTSNTTAKNTPVDIIAPVDKVKDTSCTVNASSEIRKEVAVPSSSRQSIPKQFTRVSSSIVTKRVSKEISQKHKELGLDISDSDSDVEQDIDLNAKSTSSADSEKPKTVNVPKTERKMAILIDPVQKGKRKENAPALKNVKKMNEEKDKDKIGRAMLRQALDLKLPVNELMRPLQEKGFTLQKVNDTYCIPISADDAVDVMIEFLRQTGHSEMWPVLVRQRRDGNISPLVNSEEETFLNVSASLIEDDNLLNLFVQRIIFEIATTDSLDSKHCGCFARLLSHSVFYSNFDDEQKVRCMKQFVNIMLIKHEINSMRSIAYCLNSNVGHLLAWIVEEIEDNSLFNITFRALLYMDDEQAAVINWLLSSKFQIGHIAKPQNAEIVSSCRSVYTRYCQKGNMMMSENRVHINPEVLRDMECSIKVAKTNNSDLLQFIFDELGIIMKRMKGQLLQDSPSDDLSTRFAPVDQPKMTINESNSIALKMEWIVSMLRVFVESKLYMMVFSALRVIATEIVDVKEVVNSEKCDKVDADGIVWIRHAVSLMDDFISEFTSFKLQKSC